MMKPSELLNFSIAGGFSLCCVKDASHLGRAMVSGSGIKLLFDTEHYDKSCENRPNNDNIEVVY